MAVRLLMLDMAWCRVLLSLDHWNVESLECAPGTIFVSSKAVLYSAHVPGPLQTLTLSRRALSLQKIFDRPTNWSAPLPRTENSEV